MKKTRQYSFLTGFPIAFFLVCTLYLQSGKAPWVDECYTYYGITHETFGSFADSIYSGVNFSPPLYFLLNWIVQIAFSVTIETLRIESSIWIALGSCLIFLRCAKSFGFLPSFIGFTFVLLQSNLLIEQALEARQYGMFFGCSCLVLLFFPVDSEPDSRTRKTLYFFSLLALGLTHYLGIVFCIITGCTRLWFLRRERSKLTLLLPDISSFVILSATYFTLLSKQSSHLNTWQKDNSLEALFSLYLDSIAPLSILAVAIPMLMLISANPPKVSENGNRERKNSVPLSLLVVSFLWALVPLFFWILSHASGLNLFQGRYFIPKEAAFVVILSFCIKTLMTRCAPIKYISSNHLALVPLLTSLGICGLSAKRILFGLDPSINYHHGLITNSKIAHNPLPKFYSGDHLFFPNLYANKSNSSDHLIVANERLRSVYQNFAPVIKTNVLEKPLPHSYILIMDKSIGSSDQIIPPTNKIRISKIVGPNGLTNAYKVESSETKVD